MQVPSLVALLHVAALAATLPTAAALAAGGRGGSVLRLSSSGDGPITKVVHLLQDMIKQVEAEAKEDEDIYGKMECWCQTNREEKTAAIADNEARLVQLAAAIEEGEARAAQLTTEIASLKVSIAQDQEALEQATALHAKEKAEFVQTEKDLMEASTTLKGAIAVLAKAQPGQALTQVRELVSRLQLASSEGSSSTWPALKASPYAAAMQKDFWDLMGALPRHGAPERVVTGLEQQPMHGGAAGAKSYNGRSPRIFGLLSQMKRNFDKELSQSQKAHIMAEIAFQRLRAAKEGEIASASRALEAKTALLAETKQAVAQAKEDVETTTSVLEADKIFLADLEKRCATAAKDREARVQARTDEQAAIGEAIAILSADDAKDVFSRTLSFVQVERRTTSRRSAGATLLQAKALRQGRASASAQLLAIARRSSGTDASWRLATLAVSVQLDGIEQVKKLMADMVQTLKRQSREEIEKNDQCKEDIHANEMAAREKQTEVKDLEGKAAGLQGLMRQRDEELVELRAQITQAHVSLKAAGAERKAENKEFQQVVADQRETVRLLGLAIERLEKHYDQAFVQVGTQQAPPPSAGLEYKRNSGSRGVLQILEKIIQEAQRADQEAVEEEQAAQVSYSELVAGINEVVKASQASINQKTAERAQAEADMLMTKKDLASTSELLEDLGRQNGDLHLSCDYLLKNFNVREAARSEETGAIKEAIAILDGANFGVEDAGQ